MIDRPEAANVPETLREGVDRAVIRAHREVIERHRRLGVPLAVWQDGRVVLLDPHEVPLPTVPGDEMSEEARRQRSTL